VILLRRRFIAGKVGTHEFEPICMLAEKPETNIATMFRAAGAKAVRTPIVDTSLKAE
jgi:hypothetical protein